MLTLLPLSIAELKGAKKEIDLNNLILKGGYSAVWQSERLRNAIIGNYYKTYIERDLRNLLNIKDLRALIF